MVTVPPRCNAGTKVADVSQLIDKLKSETKVVAEAICIAYFMSPRPFTCTPKQRSTNSSSGRESVTPKPMLPECFFITMAASCNTLKGRKTNWRTFTGSSRMIPCTLISLKYSMSPLPPGNLRSRLWPTSRRMCGSLSHPINTPCCPPRH